MRHILPALRLLLLLTLLTGLAYPLAVTGLAKLAFPRQAEGSRIERGGRVLGSDLIGQPFSDPRYFWPRPSATSPAYNAAASSGSNLGPSNAALHTAVAERIATLHASDPDNSLPIPMDLVTASASGLDPHVSPEAAFWQVARVARARGMDETRVRDLVQSQVEPRTLGLFGEPRVNVLRLNLALDELR
ncbi:MAG: potassium-transporting ATPase subunit KdpC [Planctomycetota bacterium]|nr:MAG: potassium-transporting ATPase subunit KdpC [Planctomycetota bacterium]